MCIYIYIHIIVYIIRLSTYLFNCSYSGEAYMILHGSEHCLRSYLTPQNHTRNTSEKILGFIGVID